MLDQLRDLFDSLPEQAAQAAFSHHSWLEEGSMEYKRLAFLGDSVLNFTVSTTLFSRFENSSAGDLTKIRAQAVSRRSCVEVGYALAVGERMGRLVPEDQALQAALIIESEGVLAETTEAAIGACYLEYGLDRTTGAVALAFQPQVDSAIANQFDFKSDLQALLARRGEVVSYRVVDEQGPSHDKTFQTVAEVGGEEVGAGVGRTKKESEQEAARMALQALDDEAGD